MRYYFCIYDILFLTRHYLWIFDTVFFKRFYFCIYFFYCHYTLVCSEVWVGICNQTYLVVLNFCLERLHHVASSHDKVGSNRWCQWPKPSRHRILLPSQTCRSVASCSRGNGLCASRAATLSLKGYCCKYFVAIASSWTYAKRLSGKRPNHWDTRCISLKHTYLFVR